MKLITLNKIRGAVSSLSSSTGITIRHQGIQARGTRLCSDFATRETR